MGITPYIINVAICGATTILKYLNIIVEINTENKGGSYMSKSVSPTTELELYNIAPENIKEGVSIFGVIGTLEEAPNYPNAEEASF